jgi:hypothetical protein
MPRVIEETAAYYHVLSRVVDRQFVMDSDSERERFHKVMRAVAGFCGVEIVTHVIMSNHWHALLLVPELQYVTDDEFARRMKLIYDHSVVDGMMAYIKTKRAAGEDGVAELSKAKYVKRMYNLAAFVKTLKQRYTMSYNRRHGRVGTLWENRYKSVLVGDGGGALSAMAAYIDLNPVRAGLVKDPKDFRYSGYGEAMGGGEAARAGLGRVLGDSGGWEEVRARYRQLLYVTGEKQVVLEGPVKPGFSYEEVEKVIGLKGKLPLNEILRCRVRYFTDGVILGSRNFVEDAFQLLACTHYPETGAWFRQNRPGACREVS